MRLGAHLPAALGAVCLAVLAACAGRLEPDSIAAGPCETAGRSEACVTQGAAGSQVCLPDVLLWSECALPGQTSTTPQPICRLGEPQSCDAAGVPGNQLCLPDDSGRAAWSPCEPDCSYCGNGSGGSTGGSGSTPLVLSFSNAPVTFSRDDGHGFALSTRASTINDWPTAATPWLALDRDGNGSIDDGGELFGSATTLENGMHADNGFEALRELDSDGDGRITPLDEAWNRLVVWADRDGDRRSAATEITPLAALGVVSIDLGYRVERVCDARGNCEAERAPLTMRDASGEETRGSVVDVHLRAQ
jgi:hypothetical protein